MDIEVVMKNFQEMTESIQKAQEKFQTKIDDVKKTIGEIPNKYSGRAESFINIKINQATNKLNKIIEAVKKWIEEKKQAIQDWLDEIKTKIQEQLERMLKKILEALI